MGAGDGGYVVHRARLDAKLFAIAIDASADALADGSWRAKRAGLANTAFVVAGVERLADELRAVADEVTVHLPWGSLLAGLVSADGAVLGPLAMLLKPEGELRILLSATERDGFAALTASALIALAPAYARLGLALVEARAATPDDSRASRSSWAKRLGVGRDRSAVLARYRRRDPAS